MKIKWTLEFVPLLVFLLALASVALALPEGMGGHNWMSYLPDNLSVGQVNMPGTHDAGAYHCKAAYYIGLYVTKLKVEIGNFFECQEINITKQFNIGARNFDLRYAWPNLWNSSSLSPVISHDFIICHGAAHCEDDYGNGLRFFEHCMKELKECLANNPSEFVVMTYQHENDYADNYDEYDWESGYRPACDEATAVAYMDSDLDALCASEPAVYKRIRRGDPLPSLKEARGKILIVYEKDYTSPGQWNNTASRKKQQATQYWNGAIETSYGKFYMDEYQDSEHNVPLYYSVSFCDTSSFIADIAAPPESSVLTSWIAGGGYDFKDGYCYGTVLFNDLTNNAARVIYSCNPFTEREYAPRLIVGENRSFECNGLSQGVEINYPDPGSSNLYSFGGGRYAKDPGSYSVTIYPGLPWEDTKDSNTMSYSWEITLKSFLPPALSASSFEYDGTEKSVSVIPDMECHSNLYVVSGTLAATRPGSYTVTVTPVYAWTNTGNKNPVTLTWEITLASLDYPSLSETSFEYDKSEKSVSLSNGNPDFDHMFEVTGSLSATLPGTYPLSIVPKVPWTATGGYEPYELSWAIVVSSVGVPSLSSTTFPYDGAEHAVRVIPPNNDSVFLDYYEITGPLEGRTVGRYDVAFTPKVPWKDGSGMAAKTLSWKITMTGGLEYPKFQSDVLKYTGEAQSPQLVNTDFNSYMSISGQQSATEPGYYVIVYKPIAISWEATGDKREYFLFYRIVK